MFVGLEGFKAGKAEADTHDYRIVFTGINNFYVFAMAEGANHDLVIL